MDNIYDVLGLGIGLAGIAYAVFANRQKAKSENMIRIHLSGIAGGIKKIKIHTEWSWRNFDKIHDNAVNLEESESRTNILKSCQYGTGDSSTADNLLIQLLANVSNIQEGMFGTTEVRYPSLTNGAEE